MRGVPGLRPLGPPELPHAGASPAPFAYLSHSRRPRCPATGPAPRCCLQRWRRKEAGGKLSPVMCRPGVPIAPLYPPTL